MVNETLNLLKSAIEKYPTKEVLSFLKNESEKAREYELKMMQMLNQSSRSQPQQQYNIQYPDQNCTVWQYNSQSTPTPNQQSGYTYGFFNTHHSVECIWLQFYQSATVLFIQPISLSLSLS